MNKDKKKEDYLFKIAYTILEWANIETLYTDEEIADLVMLKLLNIKK